MVLIGDSMDTLEGLILALDESCRNMGLIINAKTTKILTVLTSDCMEHQTRPVHLSGSAEPLEAVDAFHYLGSIVSSDCSINQEVDSRISKASCSFRRLYRILWLQRKIKVGTKLKLFKSAIMPTLLYGDETWSPLAIHM